MILIGRDLSPFTRRIVVSMQLLGIPFERRQLAVVADADEVRKFNPLTRVPALILDEDEPPLVDSWAILDHVDQIAGPERALTPPSGAERRACLRLVALTMGALEKGVSSFYERTRRPSEKCFDGWVQQCDAQTVAGLQALDAAAAAGGDWMVAGRMTQADVTSAVALDFLRFTNPDVVGPLPLPALSAIRDRLAALPSFQETNLDRYRT